MAGDEQEVHEKTHMEEGSYEMQTRSLATWEEYRNIVRACKDATKKAKAHLKLNLLGEVKDNKKGLFNDVNSTRKTRESVGY